MFVPERVKAMGWGLALWFTLAILYDGLLLALVFLLNDYPIEAYVVPVACLNPLDLARILVLLQFDTAALLGYTGAVYQQFFGQGAGQFVAAGLLALWVVVPLAMAVRRFDRMDL
ncbi:MAG: ABC transporter permease subunit [Hymenobacteraceae bacterium]|nr:ABC transporter permease subunit [Hymenobacteraceae bacterium]